MHWAKTALVGAVLIAGCAGAGANDSAAIGAPGTQPASGFVELPPLAMQLGPPNARVSAMAPSARLFFRYAPASTKPASRRLCMVWNGGPGAGSELLWLSLGPNAVRPLTELCHALFIDARNTGLSYERVSAPESHTATIASYNAYTDAVDYLRALRRLWSEVASPEVQEVVLVGESYGGVRAALMLDLAYAGDARAEAPFAAKDLGGELRALFQLAGKPASQLFRRQVLIQPTVAGSLQDSVGGELLAQPDSVLRQLAAQLGATLDPCPPQTCNANVWAWNSVAALGRSAYDYSAGSDWLAQQFASATQYADGELVHELAREAAEIPELSAAERHDAFRLADATRAQSDAASWTSRFGDLGAHDRYFIAFNTEANAAFESEQAVQLGIDGQQSAYGSAFLRGLARVDTFVTRAEFDLINYSPALGPTLERFPEVASAMLEDTGDARPGQWRVRYQDGGEAVIRAPAYVASHSVANEAAGELIDDLAAWLAP